MSIGFRKDSRRRRLASRIALALLPLLALAALILWWRWTDWAPERARYPVQGVFVSSFQGEIDWHALAAEQADFAYVRAVASQGQRDAAFARNWAEARGVGMRYGAVLVFDPCRRAGEQAALFVTTVPRDNAALPPAVDLDLRPTCPALPGRDKVLSEINTLLNLIEAHSGEPAVLRVSEAFEDRYDVVRAINRTLWLRSNLFEPGYGGRPWVMWSATDARRVDGIDGPVEWVVVGS